MSRSSFLAPPAPWMLDEEDEYLYQQTLSAAADLLQKQLERRIALLAEEGIDEVLLEIRRQMAECAVEGDITRSGDLGDLVMDIVASRHTLGGCSTWIWGITFLLSLGEGTSLRPEEVRPMRLTEQQRLQNAAALRLLPQSSKQLARRIAKQRAYVFALRFQRSQAKNIVEKLKIERELLVEVSKLKRMVTGASRKGQPAGVETLVPIEVKMRASVVQQEIAALDQVLARLGQARVSGIAAKRRVALQRQMLTSRKKLLLRRLGLLVRGQDLEQAPAIDPSLARYKRARLTLPAVYTVPTAGDVITLIRLVATNLVRKQAESDKAFRLRLRAYSQRALVRFISKSQETASGQALADAVEETILVDGPAIESEVAAGGLVSDPAGAAVDAIIEPVADELAAVAFDLQPEVSGPATLEEVDSVLASADAVEAHLNAQPDEVQDSFEAAYTLGEGSSLLPLPESPSRVGGRVTGFDPSGEDEAAIAEEDAAADASDLAREGLPSALGPATPTAAQTLQATLDELGTELAQAPPLLPVLASRLPARVSVKSGSGKTENYKLVGGLLLAGFVVYLLTSERSA